MAMGGMTLAAFAPQQESPVRDNFAEIAKTPSHGRSGAASLNPTRDWFTTGADHGPTTYSLESLSSGSS